MANVGWKVSYPGKASVSYLPFGDAGIGFYVDDVKVVGTQGALIADASVAHALNATFSDTEAEAALNALGTKVNLILARLRAHGLIAT